MDQLEACVNYLLKTTFVVYLINPLPRAAPWLNIFLLSAWLLFFINYCHLPIKMLLFSDRALVRWVRTCLSVGCAIISFCCMLETAVKWRQFAQIQQLRQQINYLISQQLKAHLRGRKRRSFGYLKTRLLPLLLILIICESIKFSSVKNMTNTYFGTVTIVMGLRLRYFHALSLMCEFNEYLCVLYETIDLLVTYNNTRPICEFNVWRPHNRWELEQLNLLRLLYGRLFEFFQLINDCAGWSMTLIAQLALSEFVCYTYWCLTYKLVNLGIGAVIFNLATIISLGCLHYQWFGLAEKINRKGQNIAALSTQLSKPLGSRRYNDLLLTFSIQTLHQKLIVTAKDFIRIDLKSLSATMHVFVNYLVFLLQFTYIKTKA
ncbi:uncharacterized protein LOC101460764 [Ceratitis capitata]|uniref:uncharacterized protein LOC101460764 n=1 Tax=Ceratitis capitata TaxID=7213 RepID=UPI00032A00FA|nr:uncharacterized protein LOC101460764 [Ceratitis capitata]